MFGRIRYLLLQARNREDPMRGHEVECFARALRCPTENIGAFNLLRHALGRAELDEVDVVLLGGSGDYSTTSDDDWMQRALGSLQNVHAAGKPTFASCWGFQAIARAMGGQVVNDPENAEVGTQRLSLTEAGGSDPVFGSMTPTFLAQMGHEDRVTELPPNTTLLASSDRVENQAYRFDDAPIYCTQFHPELSRDDLILRIRCYPHYVERHTGVPMERFGEFVEDTAETEGLLARFVERHFGDS